MIRVIKHALKVVRAHEVSLTPEVDHDRAARLPADLERDRLIEVVNGTHRHNDALLSRYLFEPFQVGLSASARVISALPPLSAIHDGDDTPLRFDSATVKRWLST